MRIRVLDDRLVDQIAAGEVVERPASVVKELVENAVDAGATDIRVQLRAGGRTLVRVVDNGSGMSREDALLCIQRHATSKIRTAEDLGNILSLGFRGEALPSIASVSRFTLTTRETDAPVGTRLQVDGGEVQSVSDAGAAAGTEIDIRSLFYNLPVRRKFLRATGTELGHCMEAVQRIALIHPEVGFHVMHEERELLTAPIVATRRERASDLLGPQGAALVPVGFGDAGIQVEGHVSPVGIHRSTRTGAVYLFVNGRFVRDMILHRALSEAYQGIVPKGRHPVVVLEVRLDPGSVDVNVHPNKIEVRFVHPRDVVRVVADGLRLALEQHGVRQPIRIDAPAPLPTWQPIPGPRPAADAVGGRWVPRPAIQTSLSPHPADDSRVAPPRATAVPEPGPQPMLVRETAAVYTSAAVQKYRDLRIIGGLGTTFILCEGPSGLVVVDRRAAQELVILGQLMDDDSANLPVQRLLTPRDVHLPVAHASALSMGSSALKSAGLDVRKVRGGHFAIHALPALLEQSDIEVVIRDIAAELSNDARRDSARLAVARLVAVAALAASMDSPMTPYQMQTAMASLDEVDPVLVRERTVAVRVDSAELLRRFRVG
ncbi:MAG: DNA mismatch repair protein MutL [Myxococcota bacterium]|jgi:DNA mismatch repair protein MutL